MLKIQVETTGHGIGECCKLLMSIPGGLKKVTRKVKQELTRKARKVVPQAISQTYYVQRRHIQNAMTVRSAMVLLRGERLNVSDFMIKPNKVKNPQHGLHVGVKREGGLKFIRSGFLIHGRDSGKVLGMQRLGRQRKDIRTLTAPAVPQMMGNEEVQSRVTEELERTAVESLMLWTGRIITGGK